MTGSAWLGYKTTQTLPGTGWGGVGETSLPHHLPPTLVHSEVNGFIRQHANTSPLMLRVQTGSGIDCSYLPIVLHFRFPYWRSVMGIFSSTNIIHVYADSCVTRSHGALVILS